WSDGDTAQNTGSLVSGNYAVTVTDSRACTASRTVSLTQPLFPITIYSTIADVQCNGLSDGAISIIVANSAMPDTYRWNNGSLLQNRTALAAGNYFLTVTDNNGCTAPAPFAITQPSSIDITPVDSNAACFGSYSGAIGLSITGGFAPYTYNWSSG